MDNSLQTPAVEKVTIRKRGRSKVVSYAKWGYIFLIPFFLVYTVFQLIPLGSTFYYSFFQYFRSGLKIIGPNYVGLENYEKLITKGSELLQYAGNTGLLWIIGFIPQILIAMLIALWLTSYRLKIKGQAFFKTVIYMPNLIMASAFSMLFFTLFSNDGPADQLLTQLGIIDAPVQWLAFPMTARSLVAVMNFLMWFGNTTIMLMAGIMGIDQSLFEAAQIDGAKSHQVFFKVTLPLLSPILVYTIITSLIGGIQMFDVPQILSMGRGSPNFSTMTLIMYLNNNLFSKNYGLGGAISVFILLVTILLSAMVYMMLFKQYRKQKSNKVKAPKLKASKYN